jgi:SAM-dependent methyltransferase
MKYNYKFNRIQFWLDPARSGAPEKRYRTCRPEFYIDLENISRMVVETMRFHADKSDTILEIGCGTGRNLTALKKAGFKNLTGIELSPKTVEIGRAHFPAYKRIRVLIGPAEELIDEVDDFDVIYTVGLLMHIPPEHEQLFERIAQKARKLIVTCEGESLRAVSEHAWNRNYQEIFEKLGWQQVEMETCEKYPPLPVTTVKRIFMKPAPLEMPVIETEAVVIGNLVDSELVEVM